MIKKIKDLLLKIKNWFLKNWLDIINWVVLVLTYAINSDLIVGLWIFTKLAYIMYKAFIKKNK